MELEIFARIDPGVYLAPLTGAKWSRAEAVSTAAARGKLLKQFIVFIASTGLKPGVNEKCRLTGQNA